MPCHLSALSGGHAVELAISPPGGQDRATPALPFCTPPPGESLELLSGVLQRGRRRAGRGRALITPPSRASRGGLTWSRSPRFSLSSPCECPWLALTAAARRGAARCASWGGNAGAGCNAWVPARPLLAPLAQCLTVIAFACVVRAASPAGGARVAAWLGVEALAPCRPGGGGSRGVCGATTLPQPDLDPAAPCLRSLQGAAGQQAGGCSRCVRGPAAPWAAAGTGAR